jgi:hypothetical protein
MLFFMLCGISHALPNLYDPGMLKHYPEFEKWVIDTGGEKKACSPSAWAALGWMGFANPNMDIVFDFLNNSEIDLQVNEILSEGRTNGCSKVALVYVFYKILGTNSKGETDLWNMSQPIVMGIYSGEQFDGQQSEIMACVENSLKSGKPAIINTKKHTYLVYDSGYGVWHVLGGTINPNNIEIHNRMNFVNLRTFDGSYAPSPDDLYADSGNSCFAGIVWK